MRETYEKSESFPNPFCCLGGATPKRRVKVETVSSCGSPFSIVMAFCGEVICGDEGYNAATVADEIRNEQQHLYETKNAFTRRGSIPRNSSYGEFKDDRQVDIVEVDPAILHEGEIKDTASLDHDDAISYDSSISSGGRSAGSSGKQQQVHVSFNPRLDYSPIPVPNLVIKSNPARIGEGQIPGVSKVRCRM